MLYVEDGLIQKPQRITDKLRAWERGGKMKRREEGEGEKEREGEREGEGEGERGTEGHLAVDRGAESDRSHTTDS
jgi:hypothetical protein